MADMRFSCPNCGQSFVADESGAGLSIACPECDETLQIPCEASGPIQPNDERIDAREVAILRAKLEEAQAESARTEKLIEEVREENRRAICEREQLHAVAEDQSARLRRALEQSQHDLATLKSAHEELCAHVASKPRLAEIVELKTARAKLDRDLRNNETTLADVRKQLDSALAEREALRARNVALELKLAANRDAFSESQLAQDNEVLRRLVDRLNGELKERNAALAKKQEKFPAFLKAIASLTPAVVARPLLPEREA